MSVWQIEYWVSGSGKSVIEKWLDKLTHEQFKAVAKELALLRKAGRHLKLPHSKALGKGLFELRERKFGFRMYYAYTEERVIILLAAGDKKSQESDIKTARRRALHI